MVVGQYDAKTQIVSTLGGFDSFVGFTTFIKLNRHLIQNDFVRPEFQVFTVPQQAQVAPGIPARPGVGSFQISTSISTRSDSPMQGGFK